MDILIVALLGTFPIRLRSNREIFQTEQQSVVDLLIDAEIIVQRDGQFLRHFFSRRFAHEFAGKLGRAASILRPQERTDRLTQSRERKHCITSP